ncbi:hypothetical protein LCGC14_2127980, partial [marine sediment metagenome]
FSRSLLGWAIAIGLAVVVLSFLSRTDRKEITPPEFWQYVRNGEITGTLVIREKEIQGTLNQDAGGTHSKNPTTDFFVRYAFSAEADFDRRLQDAIKEGESQGEKINYEYSFAGWWEGLLPQLLILDGIDLVPQNQRQVGEIRPGQPQPLVGQPIEVLRTSSSGTDGVAIDDSFGHQTYQPLANCRGRHFGGIRHVAHTQRTGDSQQIEQVRIRSGGADAHLITQSPDPPDPQQGPQASKSYFLAKTFPLHSIAADKSLPAKTPVWPPLFDATC